MEQMAFSFDSARSISWLRPYQGKGERNGRAVLDDSMVRRIRLRDPSNSAKYLEKSSSLSKELGVCEKTISLIRRRKRWGHVND